ncbi:MAG: response regulator, partial [Spirochaetaceae bacterium]|nr:response regulator [Spirochaetaceae bacterium]
EVAIGLLTSTGCDVSVSGNGRDAVEAVAAETFDAILMDVQMPVMNGHEATRRIRAWEADGGADAHVPIIAMTANSMAEDGRRAADAGMDRHVSKPIDRRELYDALADLLNRPSAGRTAGSPVPPTHDDGHGTGLAVELPGLDLSTAMARFQGDPNKLTTFLLRFATNRAETAQELRTALANDDWQTMRLLAHTLKGLAGTIGANQLQAAARELEEATSEDAPADPPPGYLETVGTLVDVVDATLTELLTGLSKLQSHQAPATETARTPIGPIALTGELEELSALLQVGNANARKFMVKVAAYAVPEPVRKGIDRVSELIGRYEFQEAVAVVESLKKTLSNLSEEEDNGE